MKHKCRFGSLNVGDSFEWCGKTLVKDGDRTAKAQSPKTDFIFAAKDMVTVILPDDQEEDMCHDGFGCISPGVVTDPQDLYDAYIYGPTSFIG